MSRGDLDQTEANCKVREGVLHLREGNAIPGKRAIKEGIRLSRTALKKLLSFDSRLRKLWEVVKSLIDARIPFEPTQEFYECLCSCVDYKVLREHLSRAEVEPWCTLASRYNTIGHSCIMYAYWGQMFDFPCVPRALREAQRSMHYAVQMLYPVTEEKLWRQIEVNCGIVLMAEQRPAFAKAFFAEAVGWFDKTTDEANLAAAVFWLQEAERVCPGEVAEIPLASPRPY